MGLGEESTYFRLSCARLTFGSVRPDPHDHCKIIEREVAIPRDKDILKKIGLARDAIVNLPAAIDRAGEALPWLRWLEPKYQRVTWRRITGMPWLDIAAREHRSDKTCWR